MDMCAYCGYEIATDYDHVPPRVFRKKYDQTGYKAHKDRGVPACSECNTLLSDHFLFTVGERAELIARKLNHRYKRLLRSQEWTEEELFSLGPELRDKIKGRQKLRTHTANRICHAKAVAKTDPSPRACWS